MSQGSGRMLATLAIVVVVSAIAIGLYFAGSPAEARLFRQDGARIERILGADRALTEYRREHGAFPAVLDSIAPRWDADASRRTDPATGAPFRYRVVSDTSYEICADFARPSSEGERIWDHEWDHPAGPHCFTRYSRQPESK